MLFKRGAVIDARDVDDETPLHHAAQNGRTLVAQLLLEHGADPNARNDSGETPSEFGSQNGHHGIVELLSAYVAKSVKQ
jgi:ankyrin repeat protein